MTYSTETEAIVTRKLTCDVDRQTTFTSSSSLSMMSLRLAAQSEGWKYVETKIPRPGIGMGGTSATPIKVSWDICPSCEVPEEFNTSIDMWKKPYKRTPVVVNIRTGEATYMED